MTRIPPRLGMGAPLALALALACTFALPLPAGESALTVADLAAYRAALSGRGATDRPPVPVGFRELWDHPATYRGRRVQVEGRVFRRFRQGAFGTFPPLEEAWSFSPAGDPFCLVFPETPTDAKAPGQAGQVRFVGTFLKLVEYQGSDGPRLAPLIVGPAAPVAVSVASDRESRTAQVPGFGLSRLDWAIGLAAGVLVASVLVHQHLRRPLRRPLKVEDAPAPLFDDAISTAGVPRRSDPR
ncbi:MAG: hypothetical protein QOE66_870 [Chloroflexota bacterium]|nr:hypothetical protein [Chloroflexota bacterium]